MQLTTEVIRCLSTAPEGSHVGIDEGGLCPRIIDDNGLTGRHLELGGIPEEIEHP